MSAEQTARAGHAAADADPQPGAELCQGFDALAQENENLGRELLRCYEQLSLVFEITEHIANLQDPRTIQTALLRRYGTMLSASAVYFDREGQCSAVDATGGQAGAQQPNGALIRQVLADEIEAVRANGRARVPALDEVARLALGGAHVLLGGLRPLEAGLVVIIALRAGNEPPFDSGDMLASESVLGYGGHILGNVSMVQQLQQTAFETVAALANAIDAKDNYTHGHSTRVGWLAKLVGQALGLPTAQVQMLEWAGVLHDVGKIGISEGVLHKPGRLTDAEFSHIKHHPQISYEVLKPVARLEPVLEAVLHHHENHDGSGYPEGLRGDEIPLTARIIHVVDIFDALTSTRAYRQAYSVERAIAMLKADAGRVTDPEVTAVFVAVILRHIAEHPDDFYRRFGHQAPERQEGAAGCGAEESGFRPSSEGHWGRCAPAGPPTIATRGLYDS